MSSENTSCDCGHDHGPKHIYIYSPSSAVRDKAAFKRGIKRLQALGHEVEIDSDALASHTRFAGDDATRLAAIHRAAASGADVALISRGGYGLTRLLPDIDYAAVARAIEGGTLFVGVSDFTAFQNAVLAQTGAVTWAGPSLGADFGVQGLPDDIMEACFDDVLSGHGEGTGWRMPRDKARPGAAPTEPVPPALPQEFEIPAARLWGGSLSGAFANMAQHGAGALPAGINRREMENRRCTQRPLTAARQSPAGMLVPVVWPRYSGQWGELWLCILQSSLCPAFRCWAVAGHAAQTQRPKSYRQGARQVH